MNKEQPPTEMKEPFLKAGLFSRLKGKPYKEKLRQPFVILITKDHKGRIIQGVRGGNITIGREPNVKRIELTPDKLIDLPFGRGWIAYEGEMTAYPVHIEHDSEMFYKIIQKLSLNYQDFLMRQGNIKLKTLLIVAFGIVLLLYFANKTGMIDKLIGGG